MLDSVMSIRVMVQDCKMVMIEHFTHREFRG